MTPEDIAAKIDRAADQVTGWGDGDFAVTLRHRAGSVRYHDSPEVTAAQAILCRADMVRAAEDLKARAKYLRGLAAMIGEG